MREVWIAGAGITRIGRRGESLSDLMAEAAHAALRDAGLERPDAIVAAAMNPEEFVGDGNFEAHVCGDMRREVAVTDELFGIHRRRHERVRPLEPRVAPGRVRGPGPAVGERLTAAAAPP